MLAIVCRTYEGVKALEKYDAEGNINNTSCLHGAGSSAGKRINGRFLVICLEDLRQLLNSLFFNEHLLYAMMFISYFSALPFFQAICRWVCI